MRLRSSRWLRFGTIRGIDRPFWMQSVTAEAHSPLLPRHVTTGESCSRMSTLLGVFSCWKSRPDEIVVLRKPLAIQVGIRAVLG